MCVVHFCAHSKTNTLSEQKHTPVASTMIYSANVDGNPDYWPVSNSGMNRQLTRGSLPGK